MLYLRTPGEMLFQPDIIYSYQPNSAPNGVALNNIGCIGDDATVNNDPLELRVLLLGGSTSFNEHYVRSVDQFLTARLPARRPSVFSCGRPRYTSYLNRVNLERHLLQYRPDVIGLYLGINDNIYNTFPWLSELPEIGFFNWREPSASLFYRMLRYYLFDKKLRSTPHFAGKKLRSEDILRQNVARIIEIAKANNAIVILSRFALAFPAEDSPLAAKLEKSEDEMKHFWGDLPSTVYGVERHNAVLRELADQHGLQYAIPQIPKDSRHFVDLCHLTARGAAIQGESLAAAALAAIKMGPE